MQLFFSILSTILTNFAQPLLEIVVFTISELENYVVLKS